jgi:hypothetical protein
MAKNEMSLREILEGRRKQYVSRIERYINSVYKCVDLTKVEQLEHSINELVNRAKQGDLESKTKTPETKPAETGKDKSQSNEPDTRPILTFYQYVKLRNEGKTNEQIKEDFRYDSIRQFAAFASNYVKRQNRAQTGLPAQKSKDKNIKKRLTFKSDTPEGMKQEAYENLKAFEDQGKTVLNAKEFGQVMGYGGTNSERASVLSRQNPILAQYSMRTKVNGRTHLHFKPEGLRKYLETVRATPSGWQAIEDYIPSQQNQTKVGDK